MPTRRDFLKISAGAAGFLGFGAAGLSAGQPSVPRSSKPLNLLFLGGTLTGAVMKLYQDQLQVAITLTLFVPLIIGTGGNAGSQTIATIIRAITLDEVHVSNLWQALRREVEGGRCPLHAPDQNLLLHLPFVQLH